MEVVYQVSHGWHSCVITVCGHNPEEIAGMIDRFEKAKFPEKYQKSSRKK